MARPKASETGARARRSARSVTDGALNVYNEMLLDALSSSPPPGTVEDRPIKRRKITRGNASASGKGNGVESSGPESDAEEDVKLGDSMPSPPSQTQQIAYNDSDDSAEDESDWEEVDLAQPPPQGDVPPPTGDEKLSLVLGGNADSSLVGRVGLKRKPATAAERRLRLELHKVHVLCLLAHVHLRSHWSNDETVHDLLRGLLSKKTVSYLNPDAKKSQFQRTRSFLDGLNQAIEAFKLQFKVTARGMSRSYWAENADKSAGVDLPKDLDLPVQKADFRDLAQQREASRDIGAQLFCALLRSVGVDARLVCSLQPLPFTGSTKGKPTSPAKTPVYMAAAQDTIANERNSNSDGAKSSHQCLPRGAIGSLGGRSRFVSGSLPGPGHQLLQKGKTSSSVPPAGYNPILPRRIVESSYPIYWVEAFDEAAQKWVCVDPLVTKTVGKPFKLEPPMSDPENKMSYVFAIEDDGSARDVTRRYAKAYNAKTYKNRVESTHQGAKWLARVLRLYKRSHALDRDQIEDTEFARKEAQEPLPENVQDFKKHPYYALERHLPRNEVIHPKREVGKVMNGRAGSAKGSEPIYRRRDVHIVRSADSWYRMGREIKPREQPLKRVSARRKPQAHTDLEDSDVGDDESTDTALYAINQTIEYQSPPVVNGRIPKNVYGNLDIYVPSMVPPGGAHVMHPECARAARLLGIDYGDAVTGFAFKGRHGTAIFNGAVVASEYVAAIQEIIGGFANERVQEEEARRSWEAIRMWRRLLAGLRVRERIEGYHIEGEVEEQPGAQVDLVDQSIGHGAGGGGGFFPAGDADDMAGSTPVGLASRIPDDTAGDGFVTDDTALNEETSGLLAGSDGMVSLHKGAVWPTSSIKVVYGKDASSSLSEDVGDDQAGGSIVEDGLNVSGPSLLAAVDKQLTPIGLADEDLAHATMLQRAYEGQNFISRPREHKVDLPNSESSTRPQTALSAAKEPKSSPPIIDNIQAQNVGLSSSRDDEDTAREGSGDDQGSLLSEDPDDEDADPEWLV